MLLAEVDYRNGSAAQILLEALTVALEETTGEPIFVFIGSDLHLLDCLGPLTGTLLQGREPDLQLYGTLEQPLHAQNLAQRLKTLREVSRGRCIVAVDASAGREQEIGLLRIKEGGLIPGKALYRSLPSVGQLAITGVVDTRGGLGMKPKKGQGLGLVYHMACLLSSVISSWYRNR
jgi:putative sporulation protein YyaC